MLQALQIENYALIRSLDITFDKGFTVITGETGAGKSILMGALSLILGNRADTDVLYDKSRKCIVEGSFLIDDYHFQSFFEGNDLDYQAVTTLRREINERGKSRAFINDTPVNLATLKTLASRLIDIHSQHQSLLIQNAGFRLDIVDQYAQNQELRNQYRDTLSAWRKAEKEYEELKRQCAEAALQQEFNNFTIQEIDNAQLQPDEQAELEKNIHLLTHAENIKSHLYQAAQQLSERDAETIVQQLQSVQHECAALKDISDEYQEIYNRLDAALVEIKDIAYDIVCKEQAVELNPNELDRLNERLDLIFSLQHKYQTDTIEELLQLKERLLQETNQYADHREQLAALDKQRDELHAQAQQLAEKLTQSRREIIEPLQQEMEARLYQLALPDSRFLIQLTGDGALHEYGQESADFLFSANKGVEPADISKVASGGETSRVMLALKSVITDSVLLPTVIFDEIDTGISGETANRVASVMRAFSDRHQVIAITHLPQIAANGNRHYVVFKENRDGHAVTDLREMHGEERIKAIATLICGSQLTEAALNTARELTKGQNQTIS